MKKSPKSVPYISYEEQQSITRLCIHCGLLLMQYGAESTVVVDLTKRLGVALGVNGVECALSFNAITLTTLYSGRCITTTRNTMHQGINVAILIQIGHIIMDTEKSLRHEHSIDDVQTRLNAIKKEGYPAWMVVIFVGVSCASFAYLSAKDLTISLITFVGATVAMSVRLFLAMRHFNAFISVIATAFVATLLGALAYFLKLGVHADVAVASSVLLLIPSFPLINALSDILKGYINMGVGRFVWASMLSLSACVGIVLALMILGITDWGL